MSGRLCSLPSSASTTSLNGSDNSSCAESEQPQRTSGFINLYTEGRGTNLPKLSSLSSRFFLLFFRREGLKTQRICRCLQPGLLPTNPPSSRSHLSSATQTKPAVFSRCLIKNLSVCVLWLSRLSALAGAGCRDFSRKASAFAEASKIFDWSAALAVGG